MLLLFAEMFDAVLCPAACLCFFLILKKVSFDVIIYRFN